MSASSTPRPEVTPDEDAAAVAVDPIARTIAPVRRVPKIDGGEATLAGPIGIVGGGATLAGGVDGRAATMAAEAPPAPRGEASDEPRRGEEIGRYVVLTRLGAGGMGVVFAAYDPELDRKVALKLLRDARGGPAARARLLREAQALAQLAHPNVVAVHDVGTHGEQQVYVAMEFIAGVTLQGWLERTSRSWREVLRTILPAGDGLAAAHAAGLVHRDFKA